MLDQEIPCTKGDVCIIPPNVPHGYYLSDVNGSLTIRQLEFDINDWFSGETVVKDSQEYCYGVFNDNSVIAYATLNSYMQDRIYLLYDYIECELLEQKHGWSQLIRGYLADILISTERYINSAIKTAFRSPQRNGILRLRQ